MLPIHIIVYTHLRLRMQVLRLTRALHSHFHHVVQTQHCLAEAFSDLAQKSPELQEEFTYNSDAQRSLTKNGELLLSALNFFTASVSTLCNKTIEDTLITVRQYETARVEYDAYRTDLENARPLVGLSGQGGAAVATASATTMSMPGGVGEEAQRSFAKHRDSYEKLRADIAVKMQFLDENRVSAGAVGRGTQSYSRRLCQWHIERTRTLSNRPGLERSL